MVLRPKTPARRGCSARVVVQRNHVIEESIKEIARSFRGFRIDRSPQVRFCAGKVHSTVKEGPWNVCRFGKSNRKGRRPVRAEDEPTGENGAR